MSDRQVPANVEAEKSVLGALLIENDGYLSVSQLEAAQFFRDAHRRIYRAMQTLFESGRPVDLRLLVAELDRVGDLEECGGPAYVAALVDGVPRSTNVKHYAEIVREMALRRNLLKLAAKLAEDAHAVPVKELLARTDLALTDLANGAGVVTGAALVRDGLGELASDLERLIERRGQIDGVSSGHQGLDLLTHGWQRSKVIVVAAQTSFGKSVFALDQARAFASVGQRVVYYSFEMPRKDLHWRMLSSLSEIPLTQMRWGNIRTSDEFARIQAAREVMHELPIEINDSSSRSILDIRAECRAIKAERGLGAVFIDHFQLMDGTDGENRAQQLANVSRKIQALAGELDVPVFVLSQLTLADSDANREPQLGDLRECKSLGHDADIVLMLHPYKPAEARTDTSVVPMKLLCRKQRGGRLGLVTLNLERDYVRFVEAEPPPPTPRKPKAQKFAADDEKEVARW